MDLTQDEINRLKIGLTVPSNLRQPYDVREVVRSLDHTGREGQFAYNLFELAEYRNDGIFNVMRLPKGVNLYHGSFGLAEALVFMPLGRQYFDTLKERGPSLNDLLGNGIVFKETEKFWEEISSYGNPGPAWISFVATANIYSQDREGIKGPIDCNEDKWVRMEGQDIKVKKCVLAFETMREINTVLLEDVLNISKILQYIEILTRAQWDELETVLLPTEQANPIYLRIRNRNDFRKGISLMIFGPVDDYHNILTPRKNFNDIGVRPLAEGIDKFGGNFEFYNRRTDAATIHFNRISMFNYDITTSIALCWLINQIKPNAYDGMGNSWAYKTDIVREPAYRAAIGNPSEWHHPEFFFCNASACLKRAYNNPADWQFQNYIDFPPLTRKHFKSIDKAILNYKTYKGDLIDISIWSGLITEALFKGYRRKFTVPAAQMGVIEYVLNEISDVRDITVCILASFFITDKLKYFYCTDDNCVLRLNGDRLGVLNYNLNTSDNMSIDLFNEIRVNLSKPVALDDSNYYKLISVVNMAMLILNADPDIEEKLLGFYYTTVYELGTDRNSYNTKRFVDLFKNLVKMASIVAISFILQRLGPIVLKIDRISNFVSEIFPFLKNRSQRYPGKPEAETIAALVTICNKVTDLVKFVNGLNDTFPQGILDKAIQDNTPLYNTRIFTETLYKFHPQNEVVYRQTRQRVAQAIRVNREPVVIIVAPGNYDVVKLGAFYDNEVNGFWKLLTLAEYYCPLMENLELSLKKNFKSFTSFRNSSILQTQQVYQDILHTVLDLTKPVYELIFKHYVSHGYPILITNPPRLNHNILNLLRSLYFTNVFLEESSFAENNSLEPIDIFCIQLCSFLKSSGRLNEDGADVNKHRFSVATLMQIFQIPNDNIIVNTAIKFELNPLRIVTMCIGKTILESIATTEINTSRYYKYFILALGIAPDDPGVDQFNSEFQEFTRVISLGHYLDHCRPTTGFSQLDTEGAGDGRGPLWVKQLLELYKLTRDWNETKKFYHDQQITELEKSGFERINGAALPPIGESKQYRCDLTFQKSLSRRFMELSHNFSYAWETLVVDN